jgi:hypothetical protein
MVQEVKNTADLPTQLRRQESMVLHSAASTPGGGSASVGTPSFSAGGLMMPMSAASANRLRRRNRSRGTRLIGPPATTLNLEVTSAKTDEILLAVHGTSPAFNGLEDKDELVRTIQRCRCEHLALTPPSVLINWDVSREECLNVIGPRLPTLDPNAPDATDDGNIVAVLKEPLGSQGEGVFFVNSIDQIHSQIESNRQRAQEEPGFLDDLIARKGRIPSWGKCCFLRGNSKCTTTILSIVLAFLRSVRHRHAQHSVASRSLSMFAYPRPPKVPHQNLSAPNRKAVPSEFAGHVYL